jgi:hypothetical protein
MNLWERVVIVGLMIASLIVQRLENGLRGRYAELEKSQQLPGFVLLHRLSGQSAVQRLGIRFRVSPIEDRYKCILCSYGNIAPSTKSAMWVYIPSAHDMPDRDAWKRSTRFSEPWDALMHPNRAVSK